MIEPTNEMVNAALKKAWENERTRIGKPTMHAALKAALTVHPQPTTLFGKWVPFEPDDAMQAAGATAIRFDTTVLNKIWTANAVFRAMVEAYHE